MTAAPQSSNDVERLLRRINRSRDARSALPTFLRAARAGDLVARYAVAFCTIKGWGIRGDPSKGVAAMRRIAGEHGPAAFSVGAAHAAGIGVARSLARARHWFGVAAKLGSADGEYNLAYYCDHGLGGPRDPGKAASFYWRAARAGVTSAALNLGNLYYRGRGVRRDLRAAGRWYERAASSGSRLAARYLHELRDS